MLLIFFLPQLNNHCWYVLYGCILQSKMKKRNDLCSFDGSHVFVRVDKYILSKLWIKLLENYNSNLGFLLNFGESGLCRGTSKWEIDKFFDSRGIGSVWSPI